MPTITSETRAQSKKSGRSTKAAPEATVTRETRASVAPRAMNSAAVRPSIAPRPARRHAPVATHTAAHRPSMVPAAPAVARAPRLKKARALDTMVSQELLARYEPLVRKIAGGFQRKLPRNVLREDLIAAGMSGLWDAIRRHPDGPSESFEWYVRVRIRGAILDELRAQDWLPRRARAAAEAQSGTDAYIRAAMGGLGFAVPIPRAGGVTGNPF